MDLALLKRSALLSVALMLTVVTSSFALTNYHTITIEASKLEDDPTKEQNNPSTADMVSAPKDNNIILTGSEQANDQGTTGQTEFGQNISEKLGQNYLTIKKPLGDQLSIELEDQYIKKSIYLTIEGITEYDLTSEFVTRFRGDESFTGDPKFTEVVTYETDKEDGKKKEIITKDFGNDLSHGITITSELDPSSKLITANILIELDSVYAYFIYEDVNYYYIDLRKPSEVYDKILVIDAGHGGKDGGALSKNEEYYEKNINLDILLQLKELLDKENIKVYYTRTADETVYLRPRVELANAVDCDYFISIHNNANEVTSPNGTEVLYYDNKFKGVAAKDMAKLFSEELAKAISLEPKGIVEKHYEDIYIMDKSIVPMILIEVGYMTNTNDMNYLSQPKNRKAVAQGIFNGIMRAYEELPVTQEGN